MDRERPGRPRGRGRGRGKAKWTRNTEPDQRRDGFSASGGTVTSSAEFSGDSTFFSAQFRSRGRGGWSRGRGRGRMQSSTTFTHAKHNATSELYM